MKTKIKTIAALLTLAAMMALSSRLAVHGPEASRSVGTGNPSGSDAVSTTSLVSTHSRAPKVPTPASFETYSSLSEKVLLTEKEKAELNKSLMNPELIREARETLLATPPEDPLHPGLPILDEERNRLHLVEYLAKSMGWTANPARGNAFQAAVEVVRRDLHAVDAPLMVKKSMAGDQIELYQSLMTANPVLAESIRRNDQNTQNGKLIAYAIANHETRGN